MWLNRDSNEITFLKPIDGLSDTMSARVKLSPRQRLQRIGHVYQGTPGLRLNKCPRLGFGILQHIALRVAEEERQGAAVGVRCVCPVGALCFSSARRRA